MNLLELTQKYLTIPSAKVGRGPAHPTDAAAALQNEMQRLRAEFPHLTAHPDYLRFVELFAGGWIDGSQEEPEHFSLMIYGIGEFSDAFAHPVDPQGFHVFATSIFDRRPYSETIFSFPTSARLRSGIYAKNCDRNLTYGYYCGSFLEWLAEVVRSNGRLLL